jgi:hypothetical protein
MAGFNNGTGFRRRWFVSLSLIAAVVTIAVGEFLWQAVELSSLATVSERMDQARPLMSGLRFALIGSLAVFWSWLSFLGARSGTANETTRACWMALRRHVVGWLLLIELAIGQNLFGRFVTVVADST